MTATFYDLATSKGTLSPFTWRVKLALNYKKIPYETHWLSFVEIEPYFKSIGVPPTGKQPDTGADLYTCPALRAADGTIVAGSTAIVEYVDAAYPETPPLFPPGTRALQEAFDAFFDAQVREAMAPVCAPGFPALFDAASGEYFRRTRAAWHPERLPLEEWAPLGSLKRDEAWKTAKAGWGKLAAVYSKREAGGPWLSGAEPVFADFVALAGLCCMQKAVQDEEWDAVMAWHDGIWAVLWQAGRKYMD
ncbi:hypothetical protein AURDEDRAFT_147025 [Auricularia subglabra TFB-10046 SS5]|nr:hypothetical protein AURDEDRAFT_147025 [Auricularia subglabra TFB-10046 SS5]